MGRFRFIPLGVGDAFSARWYSSCLALCADDTWLLVDCPHPIRKVLKEAGDAAGTPLDLDRFAGVILTHLHGDHASGLEGLGFYGRFLLNRRPVLLTHPDVAADLWEHHLKAAMGRLCKEAGGPPVAMRLEDYFELHELSTERPVAFGPYQIECRPTIHHIPTTALRVRAGGRCLAYSADTAYDPGLIEWLAAGDRIIHETNHGIHTPYEKLAALPEALRRKMLLIHYPDDFDREGSVIEPLRPGAVYEV